MNSRRGFLKNFGIVSAVAACAVAARQYNYEQSKPELTDEDIKHLAPQPGVTITLVGDNRTPEEKEPEKMRLTGEGFYYSPSINPVHTNQVSMAVGKDDRLWLKIGDKWKRVALDTKL